MTNTIHSCDLCGAKKPKNELRNGVALELASKAKIVNVNEMCNSCANRINEAVEDRKK